MTRFKKILAVLLSVVMVVCCLSASASASKFTSATKIGVLEEVSHTFKNDREIIYKIVLPDSGKITIYCSEYGGEYNPKLALLDSNGKSVVKEGWFCDRINNEYEISKKGTYYLQVSWPRASNLSSPTIGYFKDLYYGFEPDHTPTLSLALNVKVGDELDFSALGTNYTGKCRWGTTKLSVATVSKGKVNVVGAGKAKIRVYMDNNEYAEITLIATKK